MTICIQCALEEFIRSGDQAKMKQFATFDETPAEHQQRVHGDLLATKRRRRELEAMFAMKMGGTMKYDDPLDNN